MTPPDDAREALVADLRAARHRVEERLAGAGAAPGAVKVVAVSKTHPAETVCAAMAAGFSEFGESYAAEFASKAAALEALRAEPSAEVAERPVWHFIGQLQTNKVRTVVPYVSVYQTVDRSSLVHELARRAGGAAVLVQVNLAGAPGRGGATFDDAPLVIDEARESGLDVIGVMGVAPLGPAAETAASFRRLRALCDAQQLRECSMGMSDDLEIAVAEGATIVRIGSAIFGNRS